MLRYFVTFHYFSQIYKVNQRAVNIFSGPVLYLILLFSRLVQNIPLLCIETLFFLEYRDHMNERSFIFTLGAIGASFSITCFSLLNAIHSCMTDNNVFAREMTSMELVTVRTPSRRIQSPYPRHRIKSVVL